jgi:hypothetical protein
VYIFEKKEGKSMKLVLATLILLIASRGYSAPKYGPNATPLSLAGGMKDHYLKTHRAPDFWALIPYYVGQDNDSACSAAALTTLLNATRNALELTQEDELLTQRTLIEKYTDDRYKYNVCGDPALAVKHGIVRLGVSVDRLEEILRTALDKLKILSSKVIIKREVIDYKNLEVSKEKFHEFLVRNEKSNDDFLLLNFTQGVLTGDGAGMIGHIAVVGAYDEKNKKVLILDPDRRWYEPYWSPEEKVFEAIADKKSDAKPGYIYLKYK